MRPEWTDGGDGVWTIDLDSVRLRLRRYRGEDHPKFGHAQYEWHVSAERAGLTETWIASTSEPRDVGREQADAERVYLKHVVRLAATMRHLL